MIRKIKRKIFSFLDANSTYIQPTNQIEQEILDYHRNDFIYDAKSLDSYNISRSWREIPTIFQLEIHNVEEYFLLWNDAMQSHDLPAAIALESVIHELIRKKEQSYRCLKPGLLYKHAPNPEQFQILGFNHLIKLGNSFILDQIDAQRNNSKIWQKVRVIIDKIVNPLQEFVEELLGHLQDKLSISEEDFSKVRLKYYCELCTIIVLEWFQELDYQLKWDFIKNPYGIKTVINCIHYMPNPMSLKEMQILLNLLIEYGYYSDVIELVKYSLEQKPKVNILELIAIGVLWAETLIEINEPVNALNLIRTILHYLQDKKGEILLTKLSNDIEITNEFPKIFEGCITDSPKPTESEKSSYEGQLLKLKCLTAGMIGLHRLNKQELESEFLSYIKNLIEENQDTKLQMLGWFGLSKYFHEEKAYKSEFDSLIKAQSTDSYVKTPLLIPNNPVEITNNPTLELPNLIDQRLSELNKFGMNSTILSDLDRKKKIWYYLKLGTDAQAMGSHNHAVKIGLKAIEILKPSDPDQIKKQIYEILIFSHLYLQQWLDAQTYIELATPLDKDPLYYQIYAVISELALKKDPEAHRHFLNIWKIMQLQLREPESFLPSLTTGLLHIAEFLGESNFESFISKICEIKDFKSLTTDEQALFLIDMGNFTADIGDYRFSEQLYHNASEIAVENSIKSFAINGIGTIKFNIGLYQDGIQKYKEAIKLDDNNISLYQNLANLYSEISDYQNAIQIIDKAISLAVVSSFPLDELIWKKFEIVRLNSGYIHINSVKSQAAKNHLQQAEYSFDKALKERDLQFNANQLISELTNGIDAIFQEKLMSPLINKLNSLYRHHPETIPKKLEKNLAIKNMRNGKPVNLGQWSYLIKELIKVPIDPTYQPLRSALEMYSDSDLDIIGARSKKLAEWRNPNVHGAIISFDDYINKRIDIISIINQLIDLLYKTCNKN